MQNFKITNVRGHNASCTVSNAEGEYVATFYYNQEEKTVFTNNNINLIMDAGAANHVSVSVPAKTKKQAVIWFESKEGQEEMMRVLAEIAAKAEAHLVAWKAERLARREAKKAAQAKAEEAVAPIAEVFNIDQYVEVVATGLVGRVTQRFIKEGESRYMVKGAWYYAQDLKAVDSVIDCTMPTPAQLEETRQKALAARKAARMADTDRVQGIEDNVYVAVQSVITRAERVEITPAEALEILEDVQAQAENADLPESSLSWSIILEAMKKVQKIPQAITAFVVGQTVATLKTQVIGVVRQIVSVGKENRYMLETVRTNCPVWYGEEELVSLAPDADKALEDLKDVQTVIDCRRQINTLQRIKASASVSEYVLSAGEEQDGSQCTSHRALILSLKDGEVEEGKAVPLEDATRLSFAKARTFSKSPLIAALNPKVFNIVALCNSNISRLEARVQRLVG